MTGRYPVLYFAFILFIISRFTATDLKAQEHHPYKPMLGDSNWWSIKVQLQEHLCFRLGYDYTAFFWTAGDSLVPTGKEKEGMEVRYKGEDGAYMKYKKLYGYDEGGWVAPIPTYYNYKYRLMGLLREDTAEQRVYFIMAGSDKEMLLYDFSLSTEDSIFLQFDYCDNAQPEKYTLEYNWIPHSGYAKPVAIQYKGGLKELSMRSWDEVYRKYDCGVGDKGMTWLEGIGSLRSPLYYYNFLIGSNAWSLPDIFGINLSCAGRDGIQTYPIGADKGQNNYDCDCDQFYRTSGINTVHSIKGSGTMLLSQDGTQLYFTLPGANSATATLQLYDMSGRLVHSGQITLTGSESTQVYSLPVPLQPGIYIGSLQAGNKSCHTRLVCGY